MEREAGVPVTRIGVRFEVDSDVVIPPFSAKVSRTILIRLLEKIEAYEVIELLRKRVSYKPYSISPVYAGQKPLLKTPASLRGKPLTLYKGREYFFEVSVIGAEHVRPVLYSLVKEEPEVELFSAKATVTDIELEVKSFEEVELPRARAYQVKFTTPTLLQIPRSTTTRHRGLRHLLLPIPSLIMWSLAMHWNTYAPHHLRIRSPSRFCTYCNHALVEVDYDLKPITVIYDERRRPRGFAGWVVYEWRPTRSRYDRKIRKLLAYANYVGVGRSRAIGFGRAKVMPLKKKTSSRTT